MLMSRSCHKRLAYLVIFIFVSSTSLATANDTVVVRSDVGNQQRRVVGVVTEFTGEILALQHASGREEKIPADRVVSIEGDWKASHQAANAAFAEGNYDAAESHYRNALADEERRWVQRRVLSQLTWCYRYLGKTDQAVKAFLLVYRDDSKTPYFATIPLSWTTGEPDLDLQRRAVAWMQDTNSAPARLIGASWSLSSARRAEAIKVLREFVNDPDPRIVYLAEAQLWRTQLATCSADDLDRWQERIDRMPSMIRGGPYYVLGLAQSRLSMHDKAAISFMRTVILYPSERDLVSDSLLAGARELETMDQTTGAIGLYREIMTKHPSDQAAREAESRLKKLANGK